MVLSTNNRWHDGTKGLCKPESSEVENMAMVTVSLVTVWQAKYRPRKNCPKNVTFLPLLW